MAPLKERTMIEIKVPDMTCGHCVSAVTKAVKALDPAATVDISLADHRVRVESRSAKDQILRVIAEAGYTPQAATAS